MAFIRRSPVEQIVRPLRARCEAFGLALVVLLLVAIIVSGMILLLRQASSCERPLRPAHFSLVSERH